MLVADRSNFLRSFWNPPGLNRRVFSETSSFFGSLPTTLLTRTLPIRSRASMRRFNDVISVRWLFMAPRAKLVETGDTSESYVGAGKEK